MTDPRAQVDEVEAELRRAFSEEPLPSGLATFDPRRAGGAPSRRARQAQRLAPLALALAIAVLVGAIGATVGMRGRGGEAGSGGSAPSARSLAAMAFDADRGVTVLFGGRAPGGSSLSDTWTWDGGSWTHLHPVTSPPARYAAVMVDDVARHRVLLLGGLDEPGPTGPDMLRYASEVWSWDGSSWSRLPVVGSQSVTGAAVWDSGRGQVVRVQSGTPYVVVTTVTDTVAGGSAPTSPTAAGTVAASPFPAVATPGAAEGGGAAPCAAQVAVTGCAVAGCVALASSAPPACVGATQGFTGTAWTPLPSIPLTAAPVGVQLATDPATRRPLALVVDAPCVGGCTGSTGYGSSAGSPLSAHLFRLDASGWTPLHRDLPVDLVSVRGASFVDAGRLGALLVENGGAVASFDGSTWHRHEPGSPAPAFLPTGRSAAGDPVRGRVTLEGGGQGSSETWTWDGARWALRGGGTPTPLPTAVPSPAAARTWPPAPTDLPACDVPDGAWGRSSSSGTVEVQVVRSRACRFQGTLTVDAFANPNVTATSGSPGIPAVPSLAPEIATVTVPIDVELPLSAARPGRVTVAAIRLSGCSLPGYGVQAWLTASGAAANRGSTDATIDRSSCDPGSELRIEVTPAPGALDQFPAASISVAEIGVAQPLRLFTHCGADTIVIGSATFVADDSRWPESPGADAAVVVTDPQHAIVTMTGTAYRFVRTDERGRQPATCE